jgi:UDP-2,3-diacylglucosamine hydrolase
MGKTYFIADAHLGSEYPERTALILSFLDMIEYENGDLYILGDFFDFWANNKTIVNNNREILEKMQSITQHGFKIAMLVGNRDLLLNQRALASFGIIFLGEAAELNLDDKRIYLTHGHMLCTYDKKFQRYKKRVWPIYRFFDHIIPGALANYLAKKFILRSKKVISSQDQTNFQFSPSVIEAYFQKGIDIIICGHAHKVIQKDFGDKSFYSLPSWEQGRGGYLLYHKGSFTCHEFCSGDQGQENERKL